MHPIAGGNPGRRRSRSRQYVKNKQRVAAELGCASSTVRMKSADATTDALLGVIAELNADARVNAILLQLPVPDSVDRFRLFDAIGPKKISTPSARPASGAFIAVSGDASYRARRAACSPCSTITRYPSMVRARWSSGAAISPASPTALVLGGRLRNATVTWCHRHTRDRRRDLPRAPSLMVSCVGARRGQREFFITADMVKPGRLRGRRRISAGSDPASSPAMSTSSAVKAVAGWLTLHPRRHRPDDRAGADAELYRRDAVSAGTAARRLHRLRRAA